MIRYLNIIVSIALTFGAVMAAAQSAQGLNPAVIRSEAVSNLKKCTNFMPILRKINEAEKHHSEAFLSSNELQTIIDNSPQFFRKYEYEQRGNEFAVVAVKEQLAEAMLEVCNATSSVIRSAFSIERKLIRGEVTRAKLIQMHRELNEVLRSRANKMAKLAFANEVTFKASLFAGIAAWPLGLAFGFFELGEAAFSILGLSSAFLPVLVFPTTGVIYLVEEHSFSNFRKKMVQEGAPDLPTPEFQLQSIHLALKISSGK